MVVLVGVAAASYFSSISLRWTQWEIAGNSQIPAGALVAKNIELNVRDAQISFSKTNWLTTPEMPDDALIFSPGGHRFSFLLHDRISPRISPYELNWHFAGLGCGDFVFFPSAGPMRGGLTGLYQVNGAGLCVPAWMLLLVGMVILASLWQRRLIKPPEGHCRQCGYDLRATPERCPECGTVVEKILPIIN